MRYVVLDLEWNQSRFPRETVREPVHLIGEVIQIGAVRLKKNLRPGKKLRVGVKPKYYTKLHRNVSKITGFTNEDLKKGLLFPAAAKKLLRFCGKDFCFLTWGTEDLPILRDNFILHGLDPEAVGSFYDLQVIFAHQIAGDNRQYSLSQAMEMLQEGTFDAHDALNDAYSTALVCRHLDLEEGIRNYPLWANDIVQNPVEIKELGVVFPGKAEAMREVNASPFLSPDGTDFITPEKWIPQNSAKYLCPAKGESGKEYLVRFRFVKLKSGSVKVFRDLYEMTPSLMQFYQERKNKFAQKKEAVSIAKKKVPMMASARK